MNRTAVAICASLLAVGFWGEILWAGTIEGKVVWKARRDNRDAVVYLEIVEGHFDPPQKPREMDQLKMEFIPHVLPVVVGTTVNFLNSDPVLHNVFTPSRPGGRFNLGSWPKGEIRSYTFKKLGLVQLLCSLHPDMLAWVVVLRNPYFAKTGPDGVYSIQDVPAGSYTLKVWHERLKPVAQNVTVPKSGSVGISFEPKKLF